QTIISIGWGAAFSFIAVYVVSEEGLNTGSATFVGIIIAARSTVGSSFQSFTRRLADRYSRTLLAAIGLAMAAIAQFIIPEMPVTETQVSLFGAETIILPWLLILFLIVGIGEAIAQPAISAVL